MCYDFLIHFIDLSRKLSVASMPPPSWPKALNDTYKGEARVSVEKPSRLIKEIMEDAK